MAADPLSATFAALADPTRRAILARLSLGESSVTELAEPFQMSLPAVTKHLKVLEKAGLISRGRSAQWRPCALKAQPLKEAVGWLEQYRQFWEQRLDRLEAYLQELQNTAGPVQGEPAPGAVEPMPSDTGAQHSSATKAAGIANVGQKQGKPTKTKANKPRHPSAKRTPKNGAH